MCDRSENQTDDNRSLKLSPAFTKIDKGDCSLESNDKRINRKILEVSS